MATKKEINAVEKTIKMWEWLRDHPGKQKWQYLESKGVKRIPEHDCYLCEIWNNVCVEYGGNFKASGLFLRDCPLGTRTLQCGHGTDSPFAEWLEPMGDEGRSKQAQRIVNACKRWLKRVA